MNKITFEFACLDDCLDKMVPSDLREVVAERDRLRERNEALEELVVGLEEVRSKEYEFKQARIEALEKDFAYHVELCTSQQARIGALREALKLINDRAGHGLGVSDVWLVAVTGKALQPEQEGEL